MSEAKVGDDVYGEDTTVDELQKKLAQICGKEAGLFVPSGTMSNLIAVGTHCQRGDEMIIGKQNHIYWYEGGGASAFMGVAMHSIENAEDGSLPLEAIRAAIRPVNDHFPRTSLVALENSHNLKGGSILPLSYCKQVRALCDEYKLQLHLDGARLWNSAVASGHHPAELAESFDTVSVCLSKGLGTPAGSVLLGKKQFITQAKRIRKALGGGMRQSGVIAAAGLYALENNMVRLVDDHARAARLAGALQDSQQDIIFNVSKPATNIIYFSVRSNLGPPFCTFLKNRGILMNSYGSTRVRAVTHLDISDADIDYVIASVREVVKELQEIKNT